MRPAVSLLLLLLASPAWAGAVEPLSPAPAKISSQTNAKIRTSLPKFVPRPAPAAFTPAATANPTPAAPVDSDLLVLPKMVVKEWRVPGNDPDVWLNERVVQHKAMAAYQDSMTELEWVLNCWFVPIFSAPPSVRARQYYEGRKLTAEISRLHNVIEVVGLSDPREAARLRQAMDPDNLPKDD